MAELRVIVEGGYNATTGASGPSVPIPVISTNTPATADNVKITDGTNVVGIISNTQAGNSLEVASGFILSGTTINGASSNINGGGVDGGSARSNWTAFVFPTGALTGTISIDLSDDGGNWVPSGSTGNFTAATNLGVFSTGRASRYARANLTGSAGVGTVTVRLMASG